jgi:hypothetical protein
MKITGLIILNAICIPLYGAATGVVFALGEPIAGVWMGAMTLWLGWLLGYNIDTERKYPS